MIIRSSVNGRGETVGGDSFEGCGGRKVSRGIRAVERIGGWNLMAIEDIDSALALMASTEIMHSLPR